MKINWWNKLASQFADIVIESYESSISGQLDIVLRKGKVALCSPNAVYSYEDLYTNYKTAFEKMDWDRLAVQDVLVLGLGLGSIPLMLEKTFKKNFHYTCVELDPAVIELAQEYTLQHLSSSMNIVCADAYDFIDYTEETFDLIAVDIFVDDTTPEQFESSTFLNNLKKCLNPGGIILYNRLTYSDTLKEKSNIFYSEKFTKTFPNAHKLHLTGNIMLLNDSFIK